MKVSEMTDKELEGEFVTYQDIFYNDICCFSARDYRNMVRITVELRKRGYSDNRLASLVPTLHHYTVK